ncbi:MAG: hypothetical protein IAB19_07450 [Proteobacteria bacterium]|uniref:Uncharacterized protein n=1 Tax=Candidatus Avisuccinivibrio stercorigallinarum TaxID=2840704 RepID=A0A9D9DB81_9GAMM|nr:hypothetical protein [Candidatus Avisuccinivibrio stercorigallinarum]
MLNFNADKVLMHLQSDALAELEQGSGCSARSVLRVLTRWLNTQPLSLDLFIYLRGRELFMQRLFAQAGLEERALKSAKARALAAQQGLSEDELLPALGLELSLTSLLLQGEKAEEHPELTSFAFPKAEEELMPFDELFDRRELSGQLLPAGYMRARGFAKYER